VSLKEYHRKRKFSHTPEPEGRIGSAGEELAFVVQMHSATKLHYDFRLELAGVLKSWAVPKGPSLNPNDQHLAVETEDHPIEYGSFEGIIPKGNYGAGTVMIWDSGTYVERSGGDRAMSESRLRQGLLAGHITFVLKGQKLAGEFALIRLQKDSPGKNWLLVKKRDGFASYGGPVTGLDRSVVTGRSLAEIAAEAPMNGEVWLPGKGPLDPAQLKGPATGAGPKEKPRQRQIAPRPAPGHRPAHLADAPAEPLPRQLRPMLYSAADVEFAAPGWLFESRLGGLRTLASIDGGDVQIYSKQGLSFNKRFPEIVAALRQATGTLLVDGEIMVADGVGRRAPRLAGNAPASGKGQPVFMVNDLWHLHGKNLRPVPLAERKAALAKLTIYSPIILFVEHVVDDRAEAERRAHADGWAGITARHGDSVYHSGISPLWVKLPDAGAQGEAARVPLTNLDKVYFPADGYTKGDLIEYYRAVASVLLPYLRDRPQSLNRHPNGITSEGFFQKDMSGLLPPWAQTVRVESASAKRSIDYLLCQNEATLLYMANLGCIELNPWLSRVPHLDHLDYTVIDIDPDEQGYDDVVKVALAVRAVLDRIGATGFCKTSGATGLHIYVPLTPGCDYASGRLLAEAICKIIEGQLPDLTTTERIPSRRRGRIYLDYMQNRSGQTLAAPYCVRPRPGAPVSAPLLWDEVRRGLSPGAFTIKTMPERLARLGDLWAGLTLTTNDVVARLEALRREFG